MRIATLILLCLCAFVITACTTTQPTSQSSSLPPQNSSEIMPVVNNSNTTTHSVASPLVTYSSADPTHLPIGDNRLSTSPKKGYVWRCGNGIDSSAGGASGTPSWNNNDGTFDETKKPHVNGNVSWPYAFGEATAGAQRIISTNDLPNHGTGIYPIQRTDAAFAFDQNPNSITGQSLTYSLPLNPTIASSDSCLGGGPVGVMFSGAALFDGLDAEGRDAGYHEVQDSCAGHPEKNGEYHYHTYSSCMNNSGLLGYAMDGFGIYGYLENGKEVTTADLDECHGRTSVVLWEGKNVSIYHYYITRDFPYSIGCFKGTPTRSAMGTLSGRSSTQASSVQNAQAISQGSPSGPPQAAFDACSGKSRGVACSFTTPRGTVQGTCDSPQGTMVCVPQR